jgi:hypothetical protein
LRKREWRIGFAAAAYLIGVATALAVTQPNSPKPEAASPQRLTVREVGSAYDAKHVEIRGVEAGAFDPALWRAHTLNLLPDVRRPLLAPREGKHRNIYAPSIAQIKDGWRIYYGGWDGSDTPNDRIYFTETRDGFLTFAARHLAIDHGNFQHVCNVNVTPSDHGFTMMCTAYPDAKGLNKPVTFFSDDGVRWNGSRDVMTATPAQLVQIDGYATYADADINGVSVLLFESGMYRLYFSDFRRFTQIARCSSPDAKRFRFESEALHASLMVNDVKKFRVGESASYLMGLHENGPHLHYALSGDGLRFEAPVELSGNVDDADRYIVAIGWVTAGEQERDGRRVLGYLYGAGSAPSLDQNRIFATWLQKKAVLHAGKRMIAANVALGPDRQLAEMDSATTASVELIAEDGKTLLAESAPVDFKPGRAYAIAIEP